MSGNAPAKPDCTNKKIIRQKISLTTEWESKILRPQEVFRQTGDNAKF
jgi:hypothetical protein